MALRGPAGRLLCTTSRQHGLQRHGAAAALCAAIWQRPRRARGSFVDRRAFAVAAAATAAATAGPPLRSEAAPLSVSSSFDGGNIETVAARGNTMDLKIQREPFTEGTDKKRHMQWFYFRLANCKGRPCTLRIVNAGEASYAPGWNGYRACCSYDRENWFRVPTSYSEKDGVMTIALQPEQDVAWFAYFAPYSYEKHEELIARCARSPGATVRSLGKTLDGRELDLVTAGTGKLNVWITARQHPGEPMAEHWVDGFLNRLLDEKDPKARQLRSLCTFRVVPNMNPDGSVRGHLRTNACGANLNREWASTGDYVAPTLERSPEVFHVLREMSLTGVDMFLDVHGDEECPHNFFAGTQGVPGWDGRMGWLYQTLAEAYQAANPDFGSLEINYGNDKVNEANMACGDAQVAHRFKCFAVTLEQPFKDCFENPMPSTGWSPERCGRLGASFLDALDKVLPDLRRNFRVDTKMLKSWVLPEYECPKVKECSWK